MLFTYAYYNRPVVYKSSNIFITNSQRLLKIDSVVDSTQYIFLIIGLGKGDSYCLIGAEAGASPASAASRRVHGLAVLYSDRLDKTVSGTGAAAPAVIGNLDCQSFQAGEYRIELVGRDVPVIGHHTAAGAAEADAEEFFFIRYEEGKVIEPHLADERYQTGIESFFEVK